MKIKLPRKGGSFKALKALGEDKMHDIDARLLSGDTALALATHIQEAWQGCLDMKRDTLRRMLERYRKDELRDRVIERIANVQKRDDTVTVAHRMNALLEIEKLAAEQRERLDKLILKESQLPPGILLRDTTNEIRLLKELLVETGRLQLETGVMHRASKTVKGVLADANGSITEFMWSEEHEQLFQLIEGSTHDAPAER